MKARLPEIGRLVQYTSLFENDRNIGLVVKVPDEEEMEKMWNNLRPESTYSPDIFFEVLVDGKIESWGEWEWNYIDIPDVEKI